ncbi:MAG: dihydropteroate synthase [Sterolibacteriaceae bacterium]|nr:dihydropteroate synthase [Sterolibacteriaceae bacterium]MBK9084310.1 dihydropteroate synthase [Sterolibacteriaceae bacterium]
MPERILFLTGRLAEKSLHRVLEDMLPSEFTYQVRDIGINVAGLMTSDMIRRRVPEKPEADRIVVPGRCRGDLDALAAHYGIPVERGPDELKDLPLFFGRSGKAADLSRHDVKIFAEIVDAPRMTIEAVLERALRFRHDGADVIDLGCLPETAFEQLEQMVRALKDGGFAVSVDSVDPDELLRGGRAGADYLLSLNEETLWVADEVASTPVLIPSSPGDCESLHRAMRALSDRGRAFYADPILDPIHFGFSDAIVRYVELRRAYPQVPIMMGIGNLTELTEADTSGITAILMGLVSELRASAILTTEVSPHARRAVREADVARRMMYAAREDSSLPRGYTSDLLTVHGQKPFPDTPEEIAEMARAIKDPSFRVQVSTDGIHVYNRNGHHRATDPFDIWPALKLQQDGGHAFYMGVETARAQIAWQLGKRYAQDQEIDWGCALDRDPDDKREQCAPGTTLEARHIGRRKS